MRLVDADKLEDNYNARGEVLITGEILYNAPTVEAIPIEWLKKFANERAQSEDDEGYWHYWGADLLQTIELWEKENARN